MVLLPERTSSGDVRRVELNERMMDSWSLSLSLSLQGQRNKRTFVRMSSLSTASIALSSLSFFLRVKFEIKEKETAHGPTTIV
jgi:hypothetical protein